MAYAYLTIADLKVGMIDKFITERSEENIEEIIEGIELQNIALIRGKLSGRYDVDAIFAATGTDRDYLIIKILTKLTLYDFIRRNAARKVPEDYVEDWKWANKQLDMLAAGTLAPDDLPTVASTTAGQSGEFYGNNYNQDWNI
jgi:hypothetical protein